MPSYAKVAIVRSTSPLHFIKSKFRCSQFPSRSGKNFGRSIYLNVLDRLRLLLWRLFLDLMQRRARLQTLSICRHSTLQLISEILHLCTSGDIRFSTNDAIYMNFHQNPICNSVNLKHPETKHKCRYLNAAQTARPSLPRLKWGFARRCYPAAPAPARGRHVTARNAGHVTAIRHVLG